MTTSNIIEESNDKGIELCQINGRWTHEEHSLFLKGLQMYGKNWKKIQSLVKTRTNSQIRSHAQKFFEKLNQRKKTKSDENNVC